MVANQTFNECKSTCTPPIVPSLQIMCTQARKQSAVTAVTSTISFLSNYSPISSGTLAILILCCDKRCSWSRRNNGLQASSYQQQSFEKTIKRRFLSSRSFFDSTRTSLSIYIQVISGGLVSAANAFQLSRVNVAQYSTSRWRNSAGHFDWTKPT